MGMMISSSYFEAMYALILILILITIFYYYATKNYNYWKKRGVAYIKPIPLFGNMWAMSSFQKTQFECFKDFYFSKEFKNKKFGGVFFITNPVLVAKDLDFIKQILIKDFEYFSDRGLTFNEKKSPLTAHLNTLGGWRWKALRMKLSPTFTSGKIKMMFRIMVGCAKELDRLLEKSAKNEEVLEMKEPLSKFTTDVIGTCAFGLQLNAMSDNESQFRKMGKKIFTPSKLIRIKRILANSMPFLAKYFELTALTKEISDFFLNTFNEVVRYRKENNVTRNDFLQLLIELKNKKPLVDDEGKLTTVDDKPVDESGKQILELTDNLLAAQAFLFFIAGFETSSTTMGFALYELALNQDLQDRLAAEIREKLSHNDDNLTHDLLQGMTYLDMVVSETLRKYPPVGTLVRRCIKPYIIPDTNIHLDPQIKIFISVLGIHRDPQYYPDPEKFDPERFTPEKKAKMLPMTYLPFGEGPRNCIGARFGLLQTKLGLATLLKRYQFEVCEKTPIPAVIDPRVFVTTLKGGVWLRIKERE